MSCRPASVAGEAMARSRARATSMFCTRSSLRIAIMRTTTSSSAGGTAGLRVDGAGSSTPAATRSMALGGTAPVRTCHAVAPRA